MRTKLKISARGQNPLYIRFVLGRNNPKRRRTLWMGSSIGCILVCIYSAYSMLCLLCNANCIAVMCENELGYTGKVCTQEKTRMRKAKKTSRFRFAVWWDCSAFALCQFSLFFSLSISLSLSLSLFSCYRSLLLAMWNYECESPQGRWLKYRYLAAFIRFPRPMHELSSKCGMSASAQYCPRWLQSDRERIINRLWWSVNDGQQQRRRHQADCHSIVFILRAYGSSCLAYLFSTKRRQLKCGYTYFTSCYLRALKAFSHSSNR